MPIRLLGASDREEDAFEVAESTFYSEKFANEEPDFEFLIFIGGKRPELLAEILRINKKVLIKSTSFFGEETSSRSKFKIVLPNLESIAIVKMVFEFCYTGSIDRINIEQSGVVYGFAKEWRMSELCVAIEAFVRKTDPKRMQTLQRICEIYARTSAEENSMDNLAIDFECCDTKT